MYFICLRLINLDRRCLEQPLLFGWRCLQYQHNQLYVLHPGEAGMCTQRHVTHFSVFCAEASFLSVSFVLCVFYISHKRCYGGKSWAGKWIPLGLLETQMSPRYVTYGQCKVWWVHYMYFLFIRWLMLAHLDLEALCMGFVKMLKLLISKLMWKSIKTGKSLQGFIINIFILLWFKDILEEIEMWV